jgi:hypothetical protein
MHRTVLLLLSFVLSTFAAISSAATITIPGSSVSFEAPDEFTPLTQEEIDKKWLRARPPSFAIGNARRTTTIAYDVRNQSVPEDQLEAGLAVFERLFDRIIAGIVWKKKEIAEIGGRRWIFLELTSNAIDTDIHNILLCTPYEGKLVIFNFNSTKEDFPQFEAGLRKALSTVAIGQK